MTSFQGRKNIFMTRGKRRGETLIALLVAVAMCFGVANVIAPFASAADTGTQLVKESFSGASVSDPNWVAVGGSRSAICLTAAVKDDPAPAGGSNLAGCTGANTSGTSDLIGKENGYLQLTDNAEKKQGTLLYNRAIPANKGLSVDFDMAMYGGTAADGIGFFLTDGSADLSAPGAMGGGLGYASFRTDPNTIPETEGVANGQFGVGLDQYGTFSSTKTGGIDCAANDSKVLGASVQANTVALRGPGSGNSGYCAIEATRLGVNSDVLKSDAPAAGERPEMKHVNITVSVPDNDSQCSATNSNATDCAVVTVSIDDTKYLSAPLTAPLSPTVKFGIAGSTGGSFSVHLIGNVAASTLKPLDDITLVKSVNRDTTNGGENKEAFGEGETIPYSYFVRNNTEANLTDFDFTDTDVDASKISCPEKELAAGASMTCVGIRKTGVTAEELEAGGVPSTATVNAKETTYSATSSLTVPTGEERGIAVNKVLTGSGARQVDANAKYSIAYSYSAGSYQYCDTTGKAQTSTNAAAYAASSGTIDIVAGESHQIENIPVGATVTFSETKPENSDKSKTLQWQAPKLPEPVTVGCGDSNVATVTNTVYKGVTVTYDGNGGTGSVAPATVWINWNRYTLANNGFARDGYTFVRWSTQKDGGITYAAGAKIFMVKDTTLYAQWSADDAEITYAPGGGTGAMANTTGHTDEQVNVSGNSFTRAGYTFVGWVGSDGTSYQPGEQVKLPAGGLTLTAQWSVKAFLVYSKNAFWVKGVTLPTEGLTDSIVKAAESQFTHDGYTFKGWNTKKDGSGTAYAAGDDVKLGPGANLLYAQWAANPAFIKYEASGGLGATATTESATGATAKFAVNGFTRNGYTFTEWNTAADGTGTVYNPGDNITMPVGTTTVYAIWAANSATLTYDGNDAQSGTTAPTAGVTDESVDIASNGFVRKGYTFAGWNSAADGSGTAYAAGDGYTLPAGGTTLYAQWTKDAETPVTPSKPTTPVKPTEPVTPTKSTTPTTPSTPAKPSTPRAPSTPVTPTTPGEPSEPATPAAKTPAKVTVTLPTTHSEPTAAPAAAPAAKAVLAVTGAGIPVWAYVTLGVTFVTALAMVIVARRRESRK